MPMTLQQLVDRLAADGVVTADEAVEMRREIFPDGVVSREEAEMLFQLNERVDGDDPAWNWCFVEAVCDHLLLTVDPQGHLSDEGAQWLAGRVQQDRVIERFTEIELVVKLLEKAESVPAGFQKFVRQLVHGAIVKTGCDIGETEVALIRRVLFAAAGSGAVAVTREEAEWLFDIDAATDGRKNAPAWKDLFVSGIMNHLFAAGPSALLEREGMMRRALWVERPGSLTSFISGAFGGGMKHAMELADQPNQVDGQFAYLRRREVEEQISEALTTQEAAWLVTRIRADGKRTANEEAVVAAVKAAKGEESLKSA